MPSASEWVDLQHLIASSIRAARLAFGWSQREFARRLGTNQSAVRRLESPRTRLLDVALASAAMAMLGIVCSLDADGPALTIRREQRDVVHARCVAYVVRRLERDGWLVAAEVEIGTGRFRGWIDVLAYRPADRALLVIEVKTVIDDVGRLLRTLGWYTRSSRVAAEALGWRPRQIVRVVAVLATEESDARIGANQALLRLELAGGAEQLLAWIRDSSASRPDGAIAMIDPSNRGRRWLRRTKADGRRSPSPYRDYRDAVARRSPASAARRVAARNSIRRA